ncbi:MAG: hypothetical protein JRE40_08085 [Deltaproteobacteria bacterium]|nr:hypothetical protein [Deltaproteobacteria bacterium]
MKLIQIAKINPDGGKAPEWMLLFKAGVNELMGGIKYIVDKTAFDALQTFIAKRGVDIVFDYEHQSVAGIRAPAAGWLKELRWDDGKGIMARVEWTEEAAGYIAKGEYRYFSPVFGVRDTDLRVVNLLSVALTNKPKTNHLKPILAKLGITDNQEDDVELLKILIAKLKMAADSTETAVMAKIDELIASAAKAPEQIIAKEVVAALGLSDTDGANVSTVVASIHALKQSAKTGVTREELAALQKQLTDRDAVELVASALAAGKITPDQKDWATKYAESDAAGFTTFVAKAPVVVPLSKLPGKSHESDTAELDGAVLQVAKLMDVSAEDIKKYGA